MKKILALSLALAAGFFAASAKEINNYLDRNGFPVLVPSVQKLERTGQGFTLPVDLAVAAPEEAKFEAALVSPLLSARFGRYKAHIARPGEEAQCRLVLTGAGVPASPDGYTLEISPRGIEIAARSTRGLYYGVQTLRNLVGNNVTTMLPGCRIVDWPDLEIRGVFMNLRLLKNSEVRNFLEVIRVFGELKYNTLMLEFADNLPMKDNPFTLRQETLSEASLRTILAAAKRHHLEVVPHLQVLSHDAWMRMHPEYKEKISARNEAKTTARDWNTSACPEKPLTRTLTDYTINETIRLIKPKRFHLGMDEMMRCEWNLCNLCPDGHTPTQFVREAVHYTELVARQGVSPWLWHDSFCDFGYSVGEGALPHLPKSTVFNMASYRAEPTVEYFDFFHGKGFKTIGVSYVMILDNIRAIARESKAHGAQGALLTYWGYLRNFFVPTGIDPLAAAGTAIAAEYQWKVSGPEVQKLDFDPARELRRRFARAPLRRPKSRYAALPIAPICNAKLGADRNFPVLGPEKVAKLVKELAGTPEGFKLNVTPDGKIAAAVLSGSEYDDYATNKLVIPVNGRLRGLSFLLTAARPHIPIRRRYFPEVAELKINYAEGKSTRIVLRYGFNINDWNALASGFDCRFVVRGSDDRGALYSLYAFDWDNPDLKPAVESVEFRTSRNFGIAPALLAVTAYLPEGITPAAESVAPASLPEHNAAVRPAITKIPAADFTDGMRGTLVSTEGRFKGKVRHAIVDDPGSPSGKALEVVLPPPAPGNKPPRLIVDVPAPKVAKLGSVYFSIRVDRPELIARSGVYFMNADTSKHNVLFDIVSKTSKAWQHLEFPFSMLAPPTKDAAVPVKEFRTIRVTVWPVADYEGEMIFRIGPVGASNDTADYVAPFRTVKVE